MKGDLLFILNNNDKLMFFKYKFYCFLKYKKFNIYVYLVSVNDDK